MKHIDQNCPFCNSEMMRGRLLITETDYCWVISSLCPNPATVMHVLIIPKDGVVTVGELSDVACIDMALVTKRVQVRLDERGVVYSVLEHSDLRSDVSIPSGHCHRHILVFSEEYAGM